MLNFNKKTIAWGVGILAVAALLVVFARQSNAPGEPAPTENSASPSPSGSAAASPSNSPEGQASPLPGQFSNLTPKCQISGELVYLSEDGPILNKSRFIYFDVEDTHDIVQWKIFPSGEDVSIGPNRFSQFELPSAEKKLTLNFNGGKPLHDQYTLTASIDYPAWVDGQTKVLNSACEGEIKVVTRR